MLTKLVQSCEILVLIVWDLYLRLQLIIFSGHIFEKIHYFLHSSISVGSSDHWHQWLGKQKST